MTIEQKVIRFFKGVSTIKLVAIIISGLLLLAYFISASNKGGDFVTFLEASTKMWEGKNIYDPPYINLRYSYSPFWALILIPVALLSQGVGAFMWLVISLLLFVRTIKLLQNEFYVCFHDKKQNVILWGGILLYMSRYIELNFHHVQMTIFLLWLILEAMVFTNKNKEIIAGILIGLGTIIKIMPIVMIPYFVYRKRFVAALSAVATVIATFFLPMIFVGSQRFWELNRSWMGVLRPDSPEFLGDAVWHLPHNLSALMFRLLVNTGAEYTPNVFSLDYNQASICIWILIAGLVIFTVFFLGTYPFQNATGKLHQLYEVGYIMLLIPLIFPHQMKYAFYFVLPAICCLGLVLITNYKGRNSDFKYRLTLFLSLSSFLLCTMTTDLIVGMHFSTITQHWKTVTIGTLLLIPALAINRTFFAAPPPKQKLPTDSQEF